MNTGKLRTKARGLLPLLIGLTALIPQAFLSHDAQGAEKPPTQCFDDDWKLIPCLTTLWDEVYYSPGNGGGK